MVSLRFASLPARARRQAFSRCARAGALASMLFAGCADMTSSPGLTAAAERCVHLEAEVRTVAWSPTGSLLAVAWADADDAFGLQLLTTDGRPAGPVIRERAWKAVVSAAGRLAWLTGPRGDHVLVEDRPGGRHETEIVGDVIDVAWTAVGYALLRTTEFEGSEVVLLDVDRPDVTQIHETTASIASFWISADPEWLVLTSLGQPPDFLETPEFEVISATSRRTVKAPGANAAAPSMPTLRHHLVYASGTRMAAIRLDAPDRPVFLGAEDALWGQISDRGVLAYVTSADASRLCLVDVAGQLP